MTTFGPLEPLWLWNSSATIVCFYETYSKRCWMKKEVHMLASRVFNVINCDSNLEQMQKSIKKVKLIFIICFHMVELEPLTWLSLSKASQC